MFSIIEQIIANHFGITQEELLRERTRPASDGRHFLWYVLHCVMGYRSKTVARAYHISPRNVLLYSAIVRDGIKNQPFYANHFRQIQADLRMLDII